MGVISLRGLRFAIAGLCAVPLLLIGSPPASAAGPCGPPVVSVIACENSLPGDPPSDWQISGNGDSTIQGFATSMSVNQGQTISFKIKTPASSYHIDILRLGYYQGNGARKIVSGLKPTVTLPQTQPSCLVDSGTGLIDCGNWGVSASWTVPSTAVSGLYIAHLVRDDTGGSSQIPFVVRNDSSHSDLVVQTSDTTWEAYNTYGGNSLYSCTVSCPPGNPLGYKGAFKVSYDRPFTFTDDGGIANPYYAEYPMIRFLEANGYDVSYISGADTDGRGPLLQNHKAFLSVGHDEYWSGTQRANVEAARDAGVNLAFFSGNEVFWKTRWEPSIDGSNTSYRTLVTYKETHFDAPTDPQDPPTWTGTWADPRFSPPADGGRPQNALTGQQFIVNSGTTDIQVPSQYAKLRFWRNTAITKLTSGQTLTLAPGTGTLGYEWDEDADNGFRPAGLFDMSATTASAQIFTDYGTNVANGTATHHLTLYRAPSGALVFGTGTVQWSWGLDSTNKSGNPPDLNMQQATVNVFADMGAQPYALLPGLVAATGSTDTTPPTSAITSPTSGSSFQDGAKVTITGTASDAGGGVVASVEVSTDDGTTWHPATMTTAVGQSISWSYSWIAHGTPSRTITSRAVDDSGNLETPTAGVSVNVSCPCSLWGPNAVPTDGGDSNDANSTELGVTFKTDSFGTVSGLRFYKVSTNTGTHVGSLWTSNGQLLARATFSGETSSGWQQVNFSSPVPINPNTTYVVSYFAPQGHYTQTEAYFYPPPSPPPDWGSTVDSPPLHALRSTGTSVDGVYAYSGSPTFPTNTFNGENYWVDPIFSPAAPPGQVTGTSATAGNASASVTWNAPTTGGPATSYIVTPYIGSTAQPATTVTGSPAPTSTTITGLTNGTTYTFTVTAVNPNGSGPPSSASNAVTPLASLSAVINGGFEGGLSGWTTGGIAPPVASTAKAHTGSGSALLGTLSGPEPSGDSTLSQTVTVPSGSSTLTFWYLPATTDQLCSGSACVYDWEEAQIRNTSGQTLASVFKSNSNSQTWTQVSFDMSAYAGQTVVLWFNVHQDGSSPADDSSMYLDDVSLNAAAPPTAPGAPTNVKAIAGNGSATVSWTAPPNGGSPITSYTITPFVGSTQQPSTTVMGSPPATTATVTGLTNGTTYTFTVAATNMVGTGPASTASNAVTPSSATVTPTFIQQVASHTGGVTSLSVTPASNITAGNRLVMLVGTWGNGNPSAGSVTDSAGNSYVEVLHFKASDQTELSVWTAPITAGGGTRPKITVTPTATADLGVAALEYSGLSAASDATAVDTTAQSSGTTSGAATVSSGATAGTATANELALGLYVDSGFGDSLTAGNGFTSRSNVSNTPDMELLAEDQLVGQGATPNATVGTGANTTWLMSTVVFKHG